MKSVAVGIISAPNLPADIAQDLKNELSDFLADSIDRNVSWKIETLVDPLIGVAEDTNEILGKVENIKSDHNWNYAICLTDLPLFFGKQLAAADASIKNSTAQISIPIFGFMPMRSRIKKAIIGMMRELYCRCSPNDSFTADPFQMKKSFTKNKYHPSNKKEKSTLLLTKRVDTHEEKGQVDVRYIIRSRVLGRLRVLLGMTFANQPWTALFSFNKLTTLSFATGSYISIFPTPWKLSIAYTPDRFIALTVLAILGTIIWVIFSHDLWEKSTEKGEERWRKLYNGTTFITLGIIVVINYCLLFIIFLVAIAIFVPPELFKAWTGLDEEPTLIYYFSLVWLITSLGTLAGAIGTGIENKEKIRDITYSYRQKQRYNEIKKEEEEAEQKKESY
ncbi:hypothetical protein CIL03_08975 [Virgibacillus indicus]|uniref:5,10-methylene-tetrahydrofolate dehydrogenase n=1 Tax=Virgibacillus indicus TaxID=2024554 RepID=A0A265NBD6_9BACI|nr:hypothetical protein [Virgibacillus indicus]OZU89131.1 hypothetical protein CIL03_08975 [Virgibacillus indicus]